MQSLVGQSIGRYKIIEEIERGCMGIMYRARQTALGREVAIRVLPPHLADQEADSVERFFREARVVAKLTHPNIVTIHDAGAQDDFYYIVMEELKGRPLNVVLQQRGRLTVKEATTILTQVASALDYAHAEGVIHRDIKPANIMVSDDGSAKLIGFRIARVPQEPGLTQAGLGLDAPAYDAPERIGGAEASPCSDIYSIGIVLYEMLTGQTPLGGATPSSDPLKDVRESAPSLRSLVPDLPAELDPLFEKALAKNPADRYATASALAAALAPIGERERSVLAPPAVQATPLPDYAPPSPPSLDAPSRATSVPGSALLAIPVPAMRSAEAPHAAPLTRLMTPTSSTSFPVHPAAQEPKQRRAGIWIAVGTLLFAVSVVLVFLLSGRDQANPQVASELVRETTRSPASREVAVVLPTRLSSASPVATVQPKVTHLAPPTDTPTQWPSETPTRMPSPRPSATPTHTPTPEPSPTLALDLVGPADAARVGASVTLECKPVAGAGAYQFETRTARADLLDWRKSPRLSKCAWNLIPGKDKYFAPGLYEWRVLALDAAGQVLSVSATRTFQILSANATRTRVAPTHTKVPTATQAAVQAPAPPAATSAPVPAEPATATPEPLPEPPTSTPEPLPTA